MNSLAVNQVTFLEAIESKPLNALQRSPNLLLSYLTMKKAVIATGGKQYVVSEGDVLDVELLKVDKKTVDFEALLVIDGDKTQVGKPTVSGAKVSAQVLEADVAAQKVTAIRYKAKKRVHKVHGHRQHHTKLKITKIA